jgi:hypothetical protein
MLLGQSTLDIKVKIKKYTMMTKNFKWLLLVSLSFVACTNNDQSALSPEAQAEAEAALVVPGSANFSKYVALGDSFTAGFSDRALFAKGQEGSAVNLLSKQFALAGGGAFTSPFMVDNVGGFVSGGVQIEKFPQRLFFTLKGQVIAPVSGISGTDIAARITGSFNNMGVPGAKSYDIMAPGYGDPAGVNANPATANPYFARFSTGPGTTIFKDAMDQSPTFFSLWTGDDVLGYAVKGGDSTDVITPTAKFSTSYNKIVTDMTAKGAKGVVANIPDIMTLPYFTRVPYNPIPLNADQRDQLNEGFKNYNTAMQALVMARVITADEGARRTITWFESPTNRILVEDEYLTDLSGYGNGLPSYRQANKDDLIVLPSQFFLGTLVDGDPKAINGVSVGLADKWVLVPQEVALVKAATATFNATIKATAETNGLAFVDVKGIFDQLLNGGVASGNFILNTEYVLGGAFSLDGLHPGPRGYALIANAFSTAINTTYGSTLPMIDLGLYPILYPEVIE